MTKSLFYIVHPGGLRTDHRTPGVSEEMKLRIARRMARSRNTSYIRLDRVSVEKCSPSLLVRESLKTEVYL